MRRFEGTCYINYKPYIRRLKPIICSRSTYAQYVLSDDEYSSFSSLKVNKKPDNVQFIHFIKGTEFKRDIFKSLYPSYKVTRSPQKADIIIYDSKILRRIVNSKNKINTYLIKNNILCNSCPLGVNKEWLIENPLDTLEGYTVYFNQSLTEQFITLYNLIKTCSNKLIGTEEMFNCAPTGIKNQTVDLQFITTIISQLQSTDIDIKIIAIDMLLSMDVKKYRNIMRFICCMCLLHGSELQQSKYYKLFISNPGNIDVARELSGYVRWSDDIKSNLAYVNKLLDLDNNNESLMLELVKHYTVTDIKRGVFSFNIVDIRYNNKEEEEENTWAL